MPIITLGDWLLFDMSQPLHIFNMTHDPCKKSKCWVRRVKLELLKTCTWHWHNFYTSIVASATSLFSIVSQKLRHFKYGNVKYRFPFIYRTLVLWFFYTCNSFFNIKSFDEIKVHWYWKFIILKIYCIWHRRQAKYD